MQVKELAAAMADAFITKTRDNGETFDTLKDGSPKWMREVCHKAHEDGSDGGMLPDDWRYCFIREAVEMMQEAGEEDLEMSGYFAPIVPDIYTSDLTAWLHSRADRAYYCDEFVRESGLPNIGEQFNTLDLLAGGQTQEKIEVYDLVLDALREIAENAVHHDDECPEDCQSEACLNYLFEEEG